MIVSKLKTKIKQIGVKNFVRDTFNTMTINKVDFNWRCRVLKKDIADYEMLKKKYGYLVNQTDWTAKSTSSIPKKIYRFFSILKCENPKISFAAYLFRFTKIST